MMRSMTVEMSPEIDDKLNMIACAKGVSKGEAMRWAFALLKIAFEEKQKGDGSSLGFVRRRPDNTLEALGVLTGI
jgi:hypothetical protein